MILFLLHRSAQQWVNSRQYRQETVFKDKTLIQMSVINKGGKLDLVITKFVDVLLQTLYDSIYPRRGVEIFTDLLR